MSDPTPRQGRYWFPAKSYGWGWGLPSAWQGWLVLAVFAALLGAGALLFPPAQAGRAYTVYAGVLGAALVAVCRWKGEPTRWRWGKK